MSYDNENEMKKRERDAARRKKKWLRGIEVLKVCSKTVTPTITRTGKTRRMKRMNACRWCNLNTPKSEYNGKGREGKPSRGHERDFGTAAKERSVGRKERE
jgi:hypothetical protein